MAGTVGGIIENKEIGIDISLMSNNLNNTEVTSQNTIKISSVSNSEIYDSGEWISKVIDIGDNFESYGKIFSTHTDSNGSNIAIQTRTSDNSNVWSDWFPIGQDGAILSTKKRYIQIKIVFHAGYSSKTVSNGQLFDSEYIDSSGTGLKLNRTYTREMTKNGENSLYKVSSNDWKRIDKLNLLGKTFLINLNEPTKTERIKYDGESISAYGLLKTKESSNKGKLYFEANIVVNDYTFVGVCSSEFNPSTYSITQLSPSVNMWTFEPQRGNTQRDNSGLNGYTTGITGSVVVGVGVDIDLGKIEFFVNGQSRGIVNTSIPPNSNLHPLIGHYGDSCITKVNFGESPFIYPIPNGYKEWGVAEDKSLILHEGQYKEWSNGTQNILGDSIKTAMTSNTNPSPFVASASSVLMSDSRFLPYKSFSGLQNDSWQAVGATNEHIQIDFGSNRETNLIEFEFYSEAYILQMPSDFEILGSNDGSNFNSITSFSGVTWSKDAMKKQFELPLSNYRHYKINVLKNNHSSWNIYIGQIRFYKQIKGTEKGWNIHQLAQLEKDGFDLSTIPNRQITTLEPIPMTSKIGILPDSDNGKLFSTTINLSKYIDIKNTEVK